jgi:hypothetical protein
MAMRWRSTFSSNRSTCSSFQEKEGSRSPVLQGLLKATLVLARVANLLHQALRQNLQVDRAVPLTSGNGNLQL